jgi:CxxC-x17-CxxC domain-containing protein
MEYQDITLECTDPNHDENTRDEAGSSAPKEFVFTAGEQEFFASRGFANQPTRCPDCRKAKKQQQRMQRHSGPREMHQAVCSNCGNQCEVPFEPRGDKPVYCNDCFAQMRQNPQPSAAA